MAELSAQMGEKQYVASFLSGCFAGVCSTCATNPLDTIRVRLSASRSATGRPHKSLTYTIRDLLESGLAHAFSRGLAANLMASLPSNGIYLSTYRYLQNQLYYAEVEECVRPAISACGAVSVTNMTLAPLFLLRTRVQVDDSLTIRQAFTDVMRRDGFLGFYRGTMTNILGRFVEEGLFWSIYELLKRLVAEGSFQASGSFLLTSAAVLSLTMVSKVIATAVSYPYNVVITHLRTVNRITGRPEYSKIWPTVRHIYQADGWAGFYKGLMPQLLRSTISKSVQIYAYEVAMYAYFRFCCGPAQGAPLKISGEGNSFSGTS
uniref:Putative mitochondrial carrier protein n=1 Tax=Trypanosoma vivax (strain Y486) TaxID=1055687 RepID=G0TVC9_TRYVY|nr:putative mitochondrial carrier protein [Trypanosoma vivax Y486]